MAISPVSGCAWREVPVPSPPWLSGPGGRELLSCSGASLVAAQQWLQRVHQEHLNTDKFGEHVHLHLCRDCRQQHCVAINPAPIRWRFAGARRGFLDGFRLGCRELCAQIERPSFAPAQPLRASLLDCLNFSHLAIFSARKRRYPGRYRVLRTSCVFSGICRDTKVSGQSLSGVECRNTPGAQHRTGC